MAANGNPAELTTRQRRAIAALLAARNVQAAAKQAAVGERTLHRWLTEPAFTAALRQAEGQALDAAARRLVGLADGAISVVVSVIMAKETGPAVKLRAAGMVLDSLLKLRELATLEARVVALEAQHGERPYEAQSTSWTR